MRMTIWFLFNSMATRHISPEANGEGGLGRDNKRWAEIHGVSIKQNGVQVIDSSTFNQTFQALGGINDDIIIGDKTLTFTDGILTKIA